ncbi:30S ribosomal protein S27ae [Nanoarchaeota archaeon]
MAKDDKKKGGEEKKGDPLRVSKLYETSGDSIKPKNQSCPKCGAGVYMASHKDRKVCGKCGYAEFSSGQKASPKKDEEMEMKNKEVEKALEKVEEKQEMIM